MPALPVSLTVDLDIHAFSGSGITDYESGLTNCILHKKGNKLQVIQRPAIDVSEDSSTISGLNDRARGIYYWEQNSKNYIIHDNDVYEDTQDSTRIAENSGTFSTGTERCTILEMIGTARLIILDAENDKGWYMSTSKVLDQIVSNFPSTLAHGGAVLDGYLFVMDEDGTIYNSAVDDPTTFPATGFITAERERDKGVYLGKHHDHLVAFGTRTIEFFYDNSNSSGSPLNRRQDISYNIGCSNGLGVWENGDIIYFFGSNPSGQIAVWKLEKFQLKQISTDSINSYLTQGLTQSGLKVVINGLSAMGHDTLLLTVYTLTGASPGQIVPQVTLSYDSAIPIWDFWQTGINSLTTFPLMAWTKRTGGQNATVAARTGEGLLYNGDIISLNDRLIPIDTLLGSDGVYVADTYELDVYVAISESSGTNISLIVRTGLIDGETTAYKIQEKETVMMENTPNTQTLTIKHSDEDSNNFDSGNTIDTTLDRKEVNRCSRFMKRNFQLEYSGDEQIFMEDFELEVETEM